MLRLSDIAHGRDNNFNLLRILAAFAVLVSHSFVLAGGASAGEPGRTELGMSVGAIAVDVFFVTSGFLVTGSLLRSRSVLAYAWARVLRVYPANLAMVCLTTFVLGLAFTTFSPASYLTSGETLKYLGRCATLFFGVSFYLPGVFGGNPSGGAVNGSLWTMPYELHMYALIAMVWVICSCIRTRQPEAALRCTLPVLTIVSGILLILNDLYNPAPRENGFLMLFFMFFSGATYFVFRSRIVLSAAGFLACLGALLLCSIEKHLFFAVYLFTLTYVVLFLAYVPSGRVRWYNRVGDYSYGTYIYAFPVQQSIAALIPGVSAVRMIVVSLPATMLLAGLSWHILEHRALALKIRHRESRRSDASPDLLA